MPPFALLAQAPTSGQRAETKKLDWLVGQWKGTGWIQMGPQGRKEFTQTETIQGKLDGLVLVIEGQGKSRGWCDGSYGFGIRLVPDFRERIFR
jgi:hypothetical protein